jgi:hypothetical protein
MATSSADTMVVVNAFMIVWLRKFLAELAELESV